MEAKTQQQSDAYIITTKTWHFIPDVAFSDEMIINLQGEVFKDNETALRDYFDDLGAVLMNFGKDRLYLRDDGRFVYAICTGTAFPEYNAGRAPHRGATFSLEFTAGDPFWYSATEAEDHKIGTTTTWTITNAGKVRTPVRIHITAVSAPALDVKVTNTTTGLYMRYRGSIDTGESVVMDGEQYSCKNNGTNDLNQFEGSFFLLEVGINNLTYSGPAGVNIDVYWRERFVN